MLRYFAVREKEINQDLNRRLCSPEVVMPPRRAKNGK